MSEATEPADLARRCARAMYGEDRVAQDLGMEIADVAPGRAVLRMAVAPAMVNGFGIAHGGYLFLLADSAFAYACNSRDVVTVAAAGDVVFVAPARAGDVLEAEAAERARFGRSGVYDVTVRRVPDGEVIAEFRGTSRTIGKAQGTVTGTAPNAPAPDAPAPNAPAPDGPASNGPDPG
ncbi:MULTISPECIES: hydroxyphenylacetyl-CoA thioesterase PaaI [Actinomadura]|uniref:Hydroxyphenylacetyl-CoA thioesterase PaaI n=1 Tax=Actinomadura yumaensis TaxID=111807 RepID=A0ABW2CPW9_9ACTN|nr:hydroxyphenylacetyl-CoA thioesterase PaaI [Actinomadura sp. J1-007]